MSIHNLLTFRVMPKVKTSQELKQFFGRWFQLERENRGISQKFVADKVGMSVTQLSRIENGQSGTRRDAVILLAQTIGADEEDALRVFYGNNSPDVDSELLGFIKQELNSSQNWTQEQKNLFLQIIRVTVAGIGSQSIENVSAIDNKEQMYTYYPEEFGDIQPISQEEAFRRQALLNADDKGTIDIDQDKKRKIS